jgi:hypothetical protein
MPFFILQLLLIAATFILSAFTGLRLEVYLASTQTNIPLEFRGILFYLPELTLIGLLLVTGLRLLVEPAYRVRLFQFGRWCALGPGKWWLLLLLWVLIGSLFALDGAVAWYTTLHLALTLAMAFLLSDLFLNQERTRMVIVVALLGGGLLQAGVALLQAINGHPLGWTVLGEAARLPTDPSPFYRATGLTGNPNHLGGYLLLPLVMIALANYGFRNSGWRFPLIAATGLILAGMVATLSRSTALGVFTWGLSVLPFVWTSLPYIVRRNLISGAMLAVLLGGAWATGLLAADPLNIYQRTFGPRNFFFEETWPVIQSSPLVGVGGGNLMLAVGPREGLEAPILRPVLNAYLFIWAEYGLPAVFLFFMGCWALLRGRNRSSGYSLVFTGAVLAFCVIALFDHYFWAVSPLRVYFFGLVGLCLGSQLLPASDWSSVNLEEAME